MTKQYDVEEPFPAWKETPKSAIVQLREKHLIPLQSTGAEVIEFNELMHAAILELDQRLANLEKLTKCVITLEELNEGDKK